MQGHQTNTVFSAGDEKAALPAAEDVFIYQLL